MNAADAPFGNCKTALLHDLRNIQSTGALVAVHSDTHVIEYCSANAGALLGIEPSALFGRTAADALAGAWTSLSSLAPIEGHLQFRDYAAPEPLIVIGHRCGAHRIFEFEPAGRSSQHWWTHARRILFVEQLTAARTVEQCLELLTNAVFERSGYDRVLVYRFLPGWDGEVVHQRCRPGIDGFLGLRFPASDIPPNARRLFTLNWQRIITDVDQETSPILEWDGETQPLDLTYSTLRSAHPVHLQYLENMGVQASFTLSLVVNGKLWGLLACHHLSPRAIGIQDRLAFEEMARLVSLQLTNLLGLIEQSTESRMRQQLSRFQGTLSSAGYETRIALSRNLAIVRETFCAGGGWLRLEGQDFFNGLVPDKLSLPPLRDFLERFSREKVSHYDALPEALQPYRALAANASGVLYIPLGTLDFIALVRPEVIETVNWAGKQEAPDHDPAAAPAALSPRHSFAVWSQKVRNTSEPWTEIELEFAAKLRADIFRFISTAQLENIALHDPLTGLANRLLFERRLQQEVRNSMAGNSNFAVHMIDLDKFKEVNDTLGHAAGDRVLKEAALRLKSAVSQQDTVARFGGDEFAILQTGLTGKAAAAVTAERIVRSVAGAYQINGQSVEIGASVGCSIWPVDTAEESELMECADLALYQVKRSGRNAYSMYAPTMRAADSRDSNAELLVRALQNDEFRMNYQPIIDARSGELRGLEAFLRWHRPGEEPLSAGAFMPLAEQKRISPAIGEWVMDAVFRQYRQWLQEGLPLVPVTINIGNAEFATQDLLGQIRKLAARYGTGCQWLRLDIKEQALMADVSYAIRKLSDLRDAGVGAHLDNFGRGFVPLGFLEQLPFQGIKLDGILVEYKGDREHFNALFNIVWSIAQVSGAQLTVTKVQDREMLEMLSYHCADLLQGNAIAPPVEAAEVAELLRAPERLAGSVKSPIHNAA